MRREIEKRLTLPSFVCDASEFEAFLQRLKLELFGTIEVLVRVNVDLPGEEITFEEISELRENLESLPDKITSFTASISAFGEDSRRISISAKYGRPSIHASGQKSAWCAGALEIARTFAENHRVWHSRLRAWHIWIITMLIPLIAMILPGRVFDNLPSALFTGVALLSLWLVSMWIFVRFDRTFPFCVVSVREQGSIIRNYSAEITAVGSIVAALAALASMIIGIIAA